MRKPVCLLAVAAILGWAWQIQAQQTKESEGAKKEIAWAKDYKQAVEQARKSGKLIMVDFYTDWCGWCKVLDKETYTDPAVIKLADSSFVSLKLNAEKEGIAHAQRYAVNGFPTILFLDAAKLPDPDKEVKGKAGEGEVAGKIVGFEKPGPFAAHMRDFAQAARDYPVLLSRIEKNGSDLEALGKLAVVLHQRGNSKKAEQMLEQGEKLDPKNTKGLLTRAYNAVADDYQEAEQFDKAIPLFRKAADTGGQDVEAVSYALISIASCYLSQSKPDKAAPELEAILRLKGISEEDRKQAEETLQQIKKQPGK
jgi:thiol-disulfide isomerase/thioredoxin